MITRRRFSAITGFGLLAGVRGEATSKADLAGAFLTPPDSAKPWAYWWWLDGAATNEGITKDLEEMKLQGIMGVLLFDAGAGGPDSPKGPKFMSPEWRELCKHAVREAARLGIEVGINLCSGWNAGGTWVTPEYATKKLVHTRTMLSGPGAITSRLPRPPVVDDFYRDIAVLACPLPDGAPPLVSVRASSVYRDWSNEEYGADSVVDGLADTRWISRDEPVAAKPEFLQFEYAEPWPVAAFYIKPPSENGPRDIEIQCSDDGSAFRPIKRLTVESGKETTVVFQEVRARYFRMVIFSCHRGSHEFQRVQVVEASPLREGEKLRVYPIDRGNLRDVTSHMDSDGRFAWEAPAGRWEIFRFGYTLYGAKIKLASPGSEGYEVDYLDARGIDLHFAKTGQILIEDAGELAGRTLKYFHIDSHEAGDPTWTPRFREEFVTRRGYDPLPFLPVLAHRVVESTEVSQRFLWDVRRTEGDLFAARFYGRFHELSQQHGLGTHPESGGPGVFNIDALQCEGINDIPMGEFWKRNAEPVGPNSYPTNANLRLAANAAHVYGKKVCQAEAFTSFACDWIDDPYTMKDIGDRAFCDGLTRNVLCFYVHQPRLDVKPGYQWAHVGTHFDRNITWWDQSHAWFDYLARCQHLLRQGDFAADFAYFYGEAARNFVPVKKELDPPLPAGFDNDVVNAEVLLERATAKEQQLVLRGGMRYRYLVLMTGRTESMSPTALRGIRKLVEGGVTLIGPPPQRAPGLTDYPRCDQEVRGLADALWGPAPEKAGVRTVGQGRVIWGKSLKDVVQADGLVPDFESTNTPRDEDMAVIHRRGDDFDAYFVANLGNQEIKTTCRFRITGRQPELWDAVTGSIRALPEFRQEGGRTSVPMIFAPRQSFFIVFGKEKRRPQGGVNFPAARAVVELGGAWEVRFDPKWGGPERITFDQLTDWTRRPEDGIRYYSGMATYAKTFDIPEGKPSSRLYLDLGKVNNVAEVRVNGKKLGVVWTAPWRVEISGAVQRRGNRLEIDVVNLWPNRLIGDATLPREKRLTVTNVKTYETVPERGVFAPICPICTDRKKKGKPAQLLSSGLLGPVTVQIEG